MRLFRRREPEEPVEAEEPLAHLSSGWLDSDGGSSEGDFFLDELCRKLDVSPDGLESG